MIRDVEPFARATRYLYGDTFQGRAIEAFTRFYEKRFGVEVVYDTSKSELSTSLLSTYALAEKMKAAGIILHYGQRNQPHDEPALHRWNADYRIGEESSAGGSSFSDNRIALASTLAEALERHIWFETSDYFRHIRSATVRQIANLGAYISPTSVTGLTIKQRTENPRFNISDQSVYTWIKGVSLLTNSDTWVPAQLVSPHKDARKLINKGLEPELRKTVTTGLATHPEREQALLSGLLEVIERDAFMITWLNQLTLPRIDCEEIAKTSSNFNSLLKACRRYRLKPHIINLITDAPTHVYCAIVEDETGNNPLLTFGLKAHRNPAVCAEHAILEALRLRQEVRLNPKTTDVPIEKASMGHKNRFQYWRQGENFKKLNFMYSGPVTHLESQTWQKDTAEQHLSRLLEWCKTNQYQCVSVPFTHSKKNVTPWHIEMVIVPELQPLYFSEDLPHIGGNRLKTVLEKFGYQTREPFVDEPHPFI